MTVMIEMHTDRRGVAVALPIESDDEEIDLSELAEAGEDPEEENETSDFLMEGELVLRDGRVELSYAESELTGMEGSSTVVSFVPEQPELVSMMRGGSVRTALVFEPHKRHLCVYDTPYSSFQVCVRTLTVQNDLLQSGKLELDYLIEVHGAKMERCRMTIKVRQV